MKMFSDIHRELWDRYHSVRVRLYIWFRPGYMSRGIALRKGKCRNCGYCCYTRFRKCKHYDPVRHCTIFNDRQHSKSRRATLCRVHPFDPKEIPPGVECGFYWEKRP